MTETSREKELRVALQKAAKALTPFSNAVFNDNGDMSVNMAFAQYEDFCNAYFALRRANDALKK